MPDVTRRLLASCTFQANQSEGEGVAPPVAYLPERWLCWIDLKGIFFFFSSLPEPWNMEMRHAHPPAEWICAATLWISSWPPQSPRRGSAEKKRREKAALEFPRRWNLTPDGMSRRCFWNKQVKATRDRIKPITQNSARRGLAAKTDSLFCIIFENTQTAATFPSESLHGQCLSQCCCVYRLPKLTSRTSDPLYQTRKHDLNSCFFFFCSPFREG